MFYLSIIKDILNEKKWLSSLMILSFILTTLAIFSEPSVKTKIKKILSHKEQFASFSILLPSNMNPHSVATSLNRLPGVQRIIVKKSDDVMADVVKELKDNNISLDADIVDSNSKHSLSLYLDPSIGRKSVVMIKKYAQKLLGPEVIFSKTHWPNIEVQSSPFKVLLVEWGSLLIVLSLSLVWMMLVTGWYRNLKAKAYVYQKFQRISLVAEKTYLIFFGSLFVGVTALLLPFYSFSAIVLTIWFSLVLLTLFYLNLFSKLSN